MSFKIITKQLSKKLPIDHELNKKTICDARSYEEIDSILYCLFEKKLSIDETEKITLIERSKILKIQELNFRMQENQI